MHGDVTTLYDLVLVSALCILTWTLDRLVRRRSAPNGKIQYYITSAGGRRFHWRRFRKQEEEHAA